MYYVCIIYSVYILDIYDIQHLYNTDTCTCDPFFNLFPIHVVVIYLIIIIYPTTHTK